MEVRTELDRLHVTPSKSRAQTRLRRAAKVVSSHAAVVLILVGGQACGQTGQLMEDPNTGNVYEKTTRLQPVVEQTIDRQQKTYYRPETVAENRPELRTVYTPVTQMRWMPYVEGRWNPFRLPTVAYRQVPETRWEARSQVVNRPALRTRWVQENHTVETPRSVVRNVPTTNYKLVATGASRKMASSNLDPSIEQRLQPMNRALPSNQPVMVASNAVGRRTSDPPRRSAAASGMPAQVLSRPNAYGAPLAPAPATTIANVPVFSVMR